MNKQKMRQVSFMIPEEQYNELKAIVEKGVDNNLSIVLRRAVNSFLHCNGYCARMLYVRSLKPAFDARTYPDKNSSVYSLLLGIQKLENRLILETLSEFDPIYDMIQKEMKWIDKEKQRIN